METMTHKNRPSREAAAGIWRSGYITGCVSGKRGYSTRAEAKKSANYQFKSGGVPHKLSAYWCPEEEPCGYYHLGTLPKVVKSGEVDRAKLRTRAELIEAGEWWAEKEK